MICFVILHYMSISETESCISSIKSSVKEEKKIIIVDNASLNGSGETLKKKYDRDTEVVIILNDKNLGFAQGNNIGYCYAKKEYHPSFIVVMNNDVEIADPGFVKKVNDIYEREEFDVLGPDVYSTSFEAHQSPKRLEHYTLEEVEQLNNSYKKRLTHNLFFYIRCFVKKSFLLRKYVYQCRRKRIDYKKRYCNVPLHGACMIFSQKYINAHNEAFLPITFFYFESEILDYICWREGRKTVYDPSIQVLHHQNVSTNMVYDNTIQKTKFSYQCNYESTRAFIQYLKENKMI